jgi:hypothetical protein
MEKPMKLVVAAVLLLIADGVAVAQGPGVVMAADGKAVARIVVADDASAPEKYAASQLAEFLGQVTGAKFDIVAPAKAAKAAVIAVGPGATKAVAPDLNLDGLGPEGVVVETRPSCLVLTGAVGAARGTPYAVFTFLEDVVGCRWWTRDASFIPHKASLEVGAMKVRYCPPLEYRYPYCTPGLDAGWSVRNKCNGFDRIEAKQGGAITYAGFVHTFYPLVPSETNFKQHPEWFAMVKGVRTAQGAQLCLTNPDLKKFVTRQVRAWIKDNPSANIISVSQNDCAGNCQCPNCAAVEKEEGSPSGLLLRFVNDVATDIEKDYPNVAIDTLAYQYTRKPPKLTKPRANVIVRLCSIECSFAQPLSAPQNAAFAADIEGWSKICRRLYIWDYVTDFPHYVQPFPNLRVLAPNIRFFEAHGCKGVFEEGNYQFAGGEMAELRTWVLAKLLWNPSLDDKALIEEFAKGYYGPAAPKMLEYVNLVHDHVEKEKFYLACYTPPTATFLSADLLTKAETVLQEAERTVADKPDLLKRMQVAHLPIRYVLIQRWAELQKSVQADKLVWPLGIDQAQAESEFEKVCEDNVIRGLNEGGTKPDSLRAFIKK